MTNAVRHGASERARVLICYGERDLDLRVWNEGRPAQGDGSPSGRGLLGMQERAHLFGGELSAGPAPDGGFTVVARLPIGDPGP